MRALVALLPISLLCVAMPAAAEETADGPICVAGFPFKPSAEDTRAIESVPVPEAYRKPFEDTKGCGVHDETALIVWHERFGTAASARAALAYLEKAYRGRTGDPDRYPALVRDELEAQFSDFERLDDIRDDLDFIAEQYLEAAEEFQDARLLVKAEEYVRPLGEVVRWMDRTYEKKGAVRPRLFNLAPVQIVDQLWRIAVLKAEISRSDDDWHEADRLLTASAPTDWDRTIKVAYSGGEDLCDISDSGPGLYVDAAKAQCRNDDDYADKVRFFVTSRVRLDLLHSGPPQIRLEDLEPLLTQRLSYYYRNDERRFYLRMAEAEHFARAAGPKNGLGSFWSALEALEAAEKLARPYEAPARFRRVANQWLELWGRADSLFSERHGKSLEADEPEKFRYAAYLRSTLANLDKIALGEPSE